MDVGVTDLRANLSSWLARVRSGEEVVVTEHGVPVVRLTAVESAAVLDRLTAEGRIGRPTRSARPTATGRARPRARRSVSAIVTQHRG
jgi:prevent-host-death family protein